LAARNPSLDQSQRDLLASVSVEVASALEILSLTRDSIFQHQVLTETKTVDFLLTAVFSRLILLLD